LKKNIPNYNTALQLSQNSTTNNKPIRMQCANCGYIFEGILYVCPKCGSNAMDKLNVNEPEWIS